MAAPTPLNTLVPLDTLAVSPASRTRDDASRLSKGLIELCKPRVTRMVVITAGLGAVIAPGSIHWGSLSITVLGTALIVAGANALNMYLEAGSDALMERTRYRPIQSGKVSAELAFVFGLGLAVLGYAFLVRWGNVQASLLAVGAFLSYVFVYTPMKRHSPYALHVGAVPGAIPPLIGWAGASGELSIASLSLFAILFVWQLPHFMAIALFRAEEYQRGGFQVYPVAKGEGATLRAMTLWSIVLLCAMLSPWWVGLAGLGYASITGVLGLAFLALVMFGRRWLATKRWARIVFIASIPHLVIALTALAVSV